MGHNVIGIRSMRLCHQSGTASTLTKPRWFTSSLPTREIDVSVTTRPDTQLANVDLEEGTGGRRAASRRKSGQR
jgi:hypothetical protein